MVQEQLGGAWAWARFMAMPLPASPSGARYTWQGYGADQLREMVLGAIENRLLPEGTILAQFVPVLPSELDFTIPTAVSLQHKRELLTATAVHAEYVRRSGHSFFSDATETEKTHGLMCVFTEGEHPHVQLDSILDFVRVEYVRVPGAAAVQLVEPFDPVLPPGSRLGDGRTGEMVFMEGAEIAQLMAQAREASVRPDRLVHAELPESLKSIRALIAEDYFATFSTLIAHGTVVACVPRVYHGDVGHFSMGGAGAGALFVIQRAVTDDDLLRLYLVTHRIAVTLAGLHDLALQEKELTLRDQYFAYVAHSLLGPAADAYRLLRDADRRETSSGEDTLVRKWRSAALSKAFEARESALKMLVIVQQTGAGGSTECRLFDVAAEVVEPLVEHVKTSRRAAGKITLPISTNIPEGTIVRVPFKEMLDVLFGALIRNAEDHLDSSLVADIPADRCELWIRANSINDGTSIIIANSGKPVDPAIAAELNRQPTETGLYWRLSRKGPGHFHLGTRKVKWIAKQLGAVLTYSSEGGVFSVMVHFPKGVA